MWINLPVELWKIILVYVNDPIQTARFARVARRLNSVAKGLHAAYIERYITKQPIPGIQATKFYVTEMPRLLNILRGLGKHVPEGTLSYRAFLSNRSYKFTISSGIKFDQTEVKFGVNSMICRDDQPDYIEIEIFTLLKRLIETGYEEFFYRVLKRFSVNSRDRKILNKFLITEYTVDDSPPESLLLKSSELNSLKCIELLIDMAIVHNKKSNQGNLVLPSVYTPRIEHLFYQNVISEKFDIPNLLIAKLGKGYFPIEGIGYHLTQVDLSLVSAIFLINMFQDIVLELYENITNSLVCVFVKSKISRSEKKTLLSAFNNQETLNQFFAAIVFNFELWENGLVALLIAKICDYDNLEILKLLISKLEPNRIPDILSTEVQLYDKNAPDVTIESLTLLKRVCTDSDIQIVLYLMPMATKENRDNLLLDHDDETSSILADSDVSNLPSLLSCITPEMRLYAITRQEIVVGNSILQDLILSGNYVCLRETLNLLPKKDLESLLFGKDYDGLFHLIALSFDEEESLKQWLEQFSTYEQISLFSSINDDEQNCLHSLAKLATLEQAQLVLKFFRGNLLQLLMELDSKRRTPLHYAAKSGDEKIFFLFYGLIPVNLKSEMCLAKDMHKFNVIDLARFSGNAALADKIMNSIASEGSAQSNQEVYENKIKRFRLSGKTPSLFYVNVASVNSDDDIQLDASADYLQQQK